MSKEDLELGVWDEELVGGVGFCTFGAHRSCLIFSSLH